jgi:RHS repeat-associated protein
MGGKLIAEYRPQENAYLYYATDQIGSTRIVTDDTGAVVYAAAHDPYGGIQQTWTSAYDPALKFSGKERDTESGLDYFGARYYDHSLYRFLSPNGAARFGSISASHSWNAYSYPANNPWAEMYAVAGWMVSGPGIGAVIRNPLPLPEPELPWWTVSYPWVSRAEDSLWVLIKTSGEKRGKLPIGIEPGWDNLRKNIDKAEAWRVAGFVAGVLFRPDLAAVYRQGYDESIEKAEKELWKYVFGYEYGSDPVMDAYLADYGMSTDPDNPLSFWNPCYVIFHLFNFDN